MSWQMRALGALFSVIYKPRFVTEEAGEAVLAREKRDPTPPRGVRRGREVSEHEVAGFPVVVVSPRGGAARRAEPDRVVVYLHGGAYTSEVVAQHWQLVAAIADGAGCEVHVPLYGLAPHHDGLAALAFSLTVVERLVDAGRRVHLAGDSAGGGLALLTAQHLDPGRRTSVTGVSVLAPWLDLGITNPDVPLVEPVDPWLSSAGLRPIARAWAGELSLADPRVSPLFGDLEALPPVALWVGTRDITLPDSRLLRDRLGPARMRYTEAGGALHVYPLLPVPEGRAGRRDLVAHVAASFGTPR